MWRIGAGGAGGTYSAQPNFQLAFWIAAGMALFTILFGTANIDANERHHGVVAAIAVEAVVKLLAMIAVGLLVVVGIGGGPAAVFARMPEGMLHQEEMFGPRWVTLCSSRPPPSSACRASSRSRWWRSARSATSPPRPGCSRCTCS